MNLTLTNWVRDKGYGMGQVVGFIPALVGGQKVHLAHAGSVFEPTPGQLGRWAGWWRIVRIDQWGVFFAGALLGMALPGILYTAAIPRGTDMRGLAIASELAHALAPASGAALALVLALMSVWILFKAQLDNLEGMTRVITDILWSGSRRVRAWRGGDVRVVYYSVLAVIVDLGSRRPRPHPAHRPPADRGQRGGPDPRGERPPHPVPQHALPAGAAPPAALAPRGPRGDGGLLRLLRVPLALAGLGRGSAAALAGGVRS